MSHFKTFAAIFSILGTALFIYFIYSVGIKEILEGIGKIGLAGFAFILSTYFLRICVRASAWKLLVYEPHRLRFYDAFSAVIIGEAVQSIIPLGILASGTSKAVAVSNRVPLVVGLSSIANENLFYSFVTSIFIISGATAFLVNSGSQSIWVWGGYSFIGVILALLILGCLMVLRQWHWGSGICNWLYKKGFLRKYLEDGRAQVRLFENLIYGFYRQYPKRFAPIILFESLYHVFGIAEVLFILTRISDVVPTFYSAFVLESVSRAVTIAFKMIPFAIGVDEASSQFISENLSLGIAVGVTIAILRKGRMLFGATVGILIILKRGLTLAAMLSHRKSTHGV